MINRNGRLICFTGIDGSGKTTQAKLLVSELETQGVKVKYLWNRGDAGFRKVFIWLGRKFLRAGKYEPALVSKDEFNNYKNKKDKLFSNPLLRFIWGLSVRIEHIIQIQFRVIPALLSGYTLVSDRYIWDSAIDLAISFNEGSEWLFKSTNNLIGIFIPKPDINIFVEIPSKIAFSRKNDIPSIEYLEERESLYSALAKEKGFFIVDGTQDIELIHSEVCKIIEKCEK